jgi:hypothetical protein
MVDFIILIQYFIELERIFSSGNMQINVSLIFDVAEHQTFFISALFCPPIHR